MCTTGVDAARGKAAPRRSSPPGGRLRSARHDVLGPLGTVGLGPHMLHQIGFLASTALIAGAAGAAVFGLLGLVAATSLLLRLSRQFGSCGHPPSSWRCFAAMFMASAFLIGPAISGGNMPPAEARPGDRKDGHCRRTTVQPSRREVESHIAAANQCGRLAA